MHEAEIEATDTDSPTEAYAERPRFKAVRSPWPLT
jgi:hypothetical protein